jgi:hypothetical protein
MISPIDKKIFVILKECQLIAPNVEAWRSAGDSIPSARLTTVDFYLQSKLRFFAQ